ncbi:MAG: serine hydrolase [bacterium]|nr:serine hydrolase [bacterium]
MYLRRALAALASATLLLTACAPAAEPGVSPSAPPTAATTAATTPAPATSAPATAEPTPTPSTSEDPAPSATPAVDGTDGSAVEIPETASGEMVRFLLGLLEGEEDLAPADLEGRLSPTLLAAISAPELAELMNTSIRPARPFTLTDYTGTESQAAATLASSLAPPFTMSISVDDAGLLDGIFFAPATPPRESATSIEEVAERLDALPLESRTLVTLTPAGGTPEVLISHSPDDAAPLASIFKLYVLLAVAQAVQDGAISWDQELPVSEEDYSVPAGELEGRDSVTVREAATLMISISDNTATDLLMRLVGRDSVEAAVEASGHADPAAMQPFPTTRELFQLGWGEEGLAEQWADADEAGRRTILEGLGTEAPPVEAIDLAGEPVWPEGVDWFASPEDIARLYEALDGAGDPAIREILTVNPGAGLEFDREAWPVIEFKGGSSVGVLTGAWRAERADGAVLLLITLGAQDAGPIDAADQAEFFGLVEDTFRIMAP